MEKRETSPRAFEARIILTGLDRIPELKRYLLRQLNWANIFQQRMDKWVLTGRLVNQSAFTVSGWGVSRFYPRSSVSIYPRGTAVPHFSACSMAFLFSPTFYPLVGQVYLFPLHLCCPIDLVTTRANMKIHSQAKGCEPFFRRPRGKTEQLSLWCCCPTALENYWI